MNQMFRDKLFLVMLVLGLLTMVAAAGVVTIRRGNGQEQKPYVDMQGQDEYFAEEAKDQAPVAGNSMRRIPDPKLHRRSRFWLKQRLIRTMQPPSRDTLQRKQDRRPETGRIPDLQQMVQRMTGKIRP